MVRRLAYSANPSSEGLHLLIGIFRRWPTTRREPRMQPPLQNGPPAAVTRPPAALAVPEGVPALKTLSASAGSDGSPWTTELLTIAVVRHQALPAARDAI